MSSTKVILGLLGGVAAGALLGVLFAPAEGKKTRKKIINKANDSADVLKDKYESIVEAMNNKYEDMLHKEEKLISNGEAKLNSLKKEFKNLDL
ncbi:YtxH domain-containing protein [Flavobacterium cellulosilyticum]|uniref:YtxH domain-containing protein n=1 Tax=Flavobacterium cellulosilyticum TaxID=2541731 RepID=A0A4R5CEF7_9FLAO|nr:YtxH domain-containing protein [Flavobacterium cellulosilyticum]TDD98431.1 YtxH domain-containing protein [Flavobacterium cellulosilyticum]